MAKLVRTPIQQTGSTEFHLFRGSGGCTGQGQYSAGKSLRAVGAGHSHKELVVDGDIIADLQALSGVLSVDTDQGTAWVGGGSKIHTLGPALHRLVWHWPTKAISISRVSAVPQPPAPTVPAQACKIQQPSHGARIALASGTLSNVRQSKTANCGWLAACIWARLDHHRPAAAVRAVLSAARAQLDASLGDLLNDLDDLIANNRHCEFFWYPQTDSANLKVINPTDAPAQYPLGGEGERCAWNFEVLPNHRPHLHTEMEYSVQADHGPACMQAIQTLLNTTFTDVRWPVEYRTLAADDVWLRQPISGIPLPFPFIRM